MRKININKRDLLVLMIIAALVIGALGYVLYARAETFNFAKEMERLFNKNKDAVFSVDKIITFSSANAIDNSEGKTLQDLNVCQFTDIAIYIDNMVNITELVKESNAMGVSTVETNDEASTKVKEHTVKKLYIDNIQINTNSHKGEKTLAYKSPFKFSEFRKIVLQTPDNGAEATDANSENNQVQDEVIEFGEQQERIDFNVVATNADNERSDYTTPTFYADCSNPITLNYMNGNIVTGYSVSTDNTQITFDGKILQSVGVDLEDISGTINFDIHLVNNLDQEFVCSVSLDIPVKSENKSIYSGYMYSMENELQNKYKFFKK